MTTIPKEPGRLKLEANAWQYIIDNSLKGRESGTYFGPSEIEVDPFFAFGSAWVVDSNYSMPLGWSWFEYNNGGTQEQPSINLLRIDLVTKRVVAIIPLPRLGFIWFNPGYSAGSIVRDCSMCEGAGKLWLVFGNGAEGPWGSGYDTSEGAAYGDANDYAATQLAGQYWPNTPPYRPRGEGHVRGLVYSIDPTDNAVKTINPLDNRVDYPQIAFGGGFVWVSQTPRPADVSVLNYYHGFSQQNWSPLLRIDPSSSYSLMIPQGQLGVADPTPRHPVLRLFPNGLSEQPFPTYGNRQFGPNVGTPASAFNINEMLFADGYLVMSTLFNVLGPYASGGVHRVSRLNVLSLEAKKGPVLDLYNILFCSLNKTIWGSRSISGEGEFAEDPGQIWVGDMDLNFTKMPIALDDWLGSAPPNYAPEPTTGLSRISFIFGMAFDGVEVFASMVVVSGWETDWSQIESVTLRISPKNKNIKSVIVFEMPSVQVEDGETTYVWLRGVPLRVIYAEDGVLWCNIGAGTPVFPIKQGRFGGWKVGKI